MLSCLDSLRDLNQLSVIVRMLAAVLCGGTIGIERSRKRRPAGFRTHILICLGAAMTTMTSQFLYLELRLYTDIARVGAQVVAGIGFIGAGTIIVTRNRRVKGLTTAAGLWVAAIVGLCCGAGYYEGAVLASVLVLMAELFFSKLEYRILGAVPQVRLLIVYRDTGCLNEAIKYIHDFDLKILDMEIHKGGQDEVGHPYTNFLVQMHRKIRLDDLIRDLNQIEGVYTVEEF